METKKMTYMQAVRLALDEEFDLDEKVIMMGQDIVILGGAYGDRHRRPVSQVRH